MLLCLANSMGYKDDRELYELWKSLIQEIKIDSKESEYKNICFISIEFRFKNIHQ